MKGRRSVAPAAPGLVRLGQLASWLSVVDVACNRCGRHGRLDTARLVAEHGAEISVPELLQIVAADCPWMKAKGARDMCGAHLPQMPRLGR
jgi:hypothetical protein